MPQLFPKSSNSFARGSLVVGALLASGAAALVLNTNRLPWVNNQGVAREQPIPFSHQHHVGGVGLDCRYCHTAVEVSATAGIPPTKTCMNCHSQIWNTSPTLEPVRESFRSDRSIHWVKVYDLPDFVYFNHSAHVNKGVGCSSCHGRIDQMPLTYQVPSLQMEWCLECHRAPEKFVRPKAEVFNAAYQPPADQLALGRRLVKEYDIHTRTTCSTCHR
jgi:Cytochrome c7 and related cytochrome c